MSRKRGRPKKDSEKIDERVPDHLVDPHAHETTGRDVIAEKREAVINEARRVGKRQTTSITDLITRVLELERYEEKYPIDAEAARAEISS